MINSSLVKNMEKHFAKGMISSNRRPQNNSTVGLRAACELLRVEGESWAWPRAAIFKICIYLGGEGLEGEESQISVLKFMKLGVGGRFTREGTCAHMADSHSCMA